jgi:hypothetical protein
VKLTVAESTVMYVIVALSNVFEMFFMPHLCDTWAFGRPAPLHESAPGFVSTSTQGFLLHTSNLAPPIRLFTSARSAAFVVTV